MGRRSASAEWKYDIRWVEALLLMGGGVTIFCKVEFSNLFAPTQFLNTLTENRGEKFFFKRITFCQSMKNE